MRARRRIHELMLLAIAACTLTAALGGCSLFLDHEAVIDVDVVEGVVPLTIRFDGCRSTGSSGIESYRWRFGNGDESFDASGTYTYLHAGSFPLTLTVRGFDGETRTTSVQIEVKACIWLADASLGKVYKLGLDGQLVTEFDAPAASPCDRRVGRRMALVRRLSGGRVSWHLQDRSGDGNRGERTSGPGSSSA